MILSSGRGIEEVFFMSNYTNERVDQSISECWDEELEEFDWDEYQHLCDIADYWDFEE